jgi:hypothetical protein
MLYIMIAVIVKVLLLNIRFCKIQFSFGFSEDVNFFYYLLNNTNLVHNSFFLCLFLFSTCFGNYVLIIRRNNCINTTSGICHSVLMTAWYAGIYHCINTTSGICHSVLMTAWYAGIYNCINTTSGICHSVWMTAWYAGIFL